MPDTSEFIKQYLPDGTTDIDITQINLDITDLSIADILRNLNKIYPINSVKRNALQSGHSAIVILCRTTTILPYKGLVIIISKEGLKVDTIATRYLLISLADSCLESERSITETILRVTTYLVSSYGDTLANLPDFYQKFVYSESIEELYDENYVTTSY